MPGGIATAHSGRAQVYERDRTTSDSDLSDVDAGIPLHSSDPSEPSRDSGTASRVARLQALPDNRARVRAMAEAEAQVADGEAFSTVASAGSSSSRAGSSRIPSAIRARPFAPAVSSFRSTRLPGRGEDAGEGVVDLTLSSDDDDDVVFNGLGATNRRRAVSPRQRVTNEEAQRNIQARSQAIAREIRAREQAIREGPGIAPTGPRRRNPPLVESDEDEDDSESSEDEPEMPPRRPVIRPGGAIIRRGDQTINYRFDNLGEAGLGVSRTSGLRDEDEYRPDAEEDAEPAGPRARLPRVAPRPRIQAPAQAPVNHDRIIGSPPPYVGPGQAEPLRIMNGGMLAGIRGLFGGGGLFGGAAEMFMGPTIGGGGGFGGMAMGMVPLAGPAGRMLLDPKAICAAVVPPAYPSIAAAPPGTTYDFNTQEMASIEPAADGSMVESRAPDLGCAYCTSKLLAPSDWRSDDDKIWVLRCGHLIHQSCLLDLSTPTKEEQDRLLPPSLPVLGAEEQEEGTRPENSRKRRKTRRGRGRKDQNKEEKGEEKHLEWEYTCPIKGCGREHTSYMKGEGGWKQRAGRGALNVFW